MLEYGGGDPAGAGFGGAFLRRWWAPGDVLLVCAVVALSLLLIWQGFSGTSARSRKAVISVNGKRVKEITLGDGRQELSVRGYQGESRLESEGGRVRMVDSACPDKLCVQTGWISRPGESIVCLPNRVVVEVVGDEEGPDVVNR